MAKKELKFKHRTEERFGSMKALHERLEDNGKAIRLHRLYLISGGFVKATAAEKGLLARFLQMPVSELFREE